MVSVLKHVVLDQTELVVVLSGGVLVEWNDREDQHILREGTYQPVRVARNVYQILLLPVLCQYKVILHKNI